MPELWVISAQGGEPRKLDLPKSFQNSAMAVNLRQPSIHPDGRHIAYTAGRDTSEVWVMENFLPPLDAAR
jgi:Tol biopolymer transport system component